MSRSGATPVDDPHQPQQDVRAKIWLNIGLSGRISNCTWRSLDNLRWSVILNEPEVRRGSLRSHPNPTDRNLSAPCASGEPCMTFRQRTVGYVAAAAATV